MKQSTVALIVSLLAFILSGMAAYFTWFRQTEILDEAVFLAPTLTVGDKELFVQGPFKMAFVNRGTRAIVVVEIVLEFFQRNEDENEPCSGTTRAELELKHDPFIVPVNNAILVNENINRSKASPQSLVSFDWKPKVVKWDGCLRFTTVAHVGTTGLEISSAFFGQYVYDPQNLLPGVNPKEVPMAEFRGATYRLFSHTQTIFD